MSSTSVITKARIDIFRVMMLTAVGIALLTTTFVRASEVSVYRPDREGFIRDWVVLGPFPNVGDRGNGLGWDTDYLEPIGGEPAARFAIGDTMRVDWPDDGPAVWPRPIVPMSTAQKVSATSFKVDLRKVFNQQPNEYVVAYARCVVESAAEQSVLIGIGSDDGYKLWVNGERIGEVRAFRGVVRDNEFHRATLRPGRNELVLKIEQDVAGFGFCLRLVYLDSKEPVTDVVVHLPGDRVERPNLIPNGDFEDGVGPQPQWWEVRQPRGAAASASRAMRAQGVAYSGLYSLMVDSDGGPAPGWQLSWAAQRPPVEPGFYRLSCWVRTAGGYLGGARAVVYFFKASDRNTAHAIEIPTGDRDWTYYEHIFESKNDIDWRHLYLLPGEKGKVWFDDLRLTYEGTQPPQPMNYPSGRLSPPTREQTILLKLQQVREALETTPVTEATDMTQLSGEVVGVFREEGFPTSAMPAAATPDWIAATLRSAGHEVRFLNAEDLANAEALNVEQINTLIMSYGEAVPIDALVNIRQFVASGGGLVSPAGVPLSRLMMPAQDGWDDMGQHDLAARYKVTPILKYYDAEKPLAAALVQDVHALPNVPSTWPLTGGDIGFLPDGKELRKARKHPVSLRAIRHLVVSVTEDGEVGAVPIWFDPRPSHHPCSRRLYIGFRGESHPWNTAAWKYAREAVIDTVRLVKQRNHPAIEDVRVTDKADYYRDGEPVEVIAKVTSYRRIQGQAKWAIQERDTGKVVSEGTQPFVTTQERIASDDPQRQGYNLRYEWHPERFEHWAYDVVLKVSLEDGRMLEGWATFLTDKPDVLRSGPVAEIRDGRYYMDGKPAWVSGVNFTPHSSMTWHTEFFVGDMAAVDESLSYLKLLGAETHRQMYFFRAATGPNFTEEQKQGKLPPDAFMHMLGHYGMVVMAGNARPDHMQWANRRMPLRDFLNDPSAIEAAKAFYRFWIERYAGAENIMWELFNEPEWKSTANSQADRAVFKEEVRRWHEQMVAYLKDLTRPTLATIHAGSSLMLQAEWDSQTSLATVDAYHHHIYGTHNAWTTTPMTYNLGYPIIVGETGREGSLNRGQFYWDSAYDLYKPLHYFILGEQGLGVSHHYLVQHTGAWDRVMRVGIVRSDWSEPIEARIFQRWNTVIHHLDPSQYQRPNVWLLHNPEQGMVETFHVYRPKLERDYLNLLRQAINVRVVADERLAAQSDLPKAVIIPSWMTIKPVVEHQLKQWQGQGVRVYGNKPWMEQADPASQITTMPGLRVTTANDQYTYVLPKRDGGATIVVVGGTRPVVVSYRGNRVRTVVPKQFPLGTRHARLIELDAAGRPLLIKSYGTTSFNGRPLIEADENTPYVVASSDRKPIAVSTTIEIAADHQRSVVVHGAFENRMDAMGEVTLVVPETIESEHVQMLAGALDAIGVKVTIVNDGAFAWSDSPRHVVLLGGPDVNIATAALQRMDAMLAGRFVTLGDKTTIHVGAARLNRDASGLIQVTNHPAGGDEKVIVIAGVSPMGLRVAARKFATLQLLESYTTEPWCLIRDSH